MRPTLSIKTRPEHTCYAVQSSLTGGGLTMPVLRFGGAAKQGEDVGSTK